MVYKCSFKYEILYAENKCKNTSFNLKFYKAYVNFENVYFNRDFQYDDAHVF